MARSYFERDDVLDGLTRAIEPQRQRATARWGVLSGLAAGRNQQDRPSSFGPSLVSNFDDLVSAMGDLDNFGDPLELPPVSVSRRILAESSAFRNPDEALIGLKRILADRPLSVYAAFAANQILMGRYLGLSPRSGARPSRAERMLKTDTLIVGNGPIGIGALSLVNSFPDLYGTTTIISGKGPSGPWAGRTFPLNNSFGAEEGRNSATPFPLYGDPSIILPDLFLGSSDRNQDDRLSLKLIAKGRRNDVTKIPCKGPDETRSYASGTMLGDLLSYQELFASKRRGTRHLHFQTIDLAGLRNVSDRTEVPSSGRFGDLTISTKNILMAGGPGDEKCPIDEKNSSSAEIWRRQQGFVRSQVDSARREIEDLRRDLLGQAGFLFFDGDYFESVAKLISGISLPGVLGLQAFGEIAELFKREAASLPEANPFLPLFNPAKRYAIIGGGDSGDTWVRLMKGQGDKSLYPKGYVSKGDFPETIQFGGTTPRGLFDRRPLYLEPTPDTRLSGRVVAWRVNPEVGLDQRARPWEVFYETKSGNGAVRTDTLTVDGILTGAGLDYFDPAKSFTGEVVQKIRPVYMPEENGNVGLQIPELGMLLLGSMCLGTFNDFDLNFPTYLEEIKDALGIDQNTLSVWLWRACTSETLFLDLFTKVLNRQ